MSKQSRTYSYDYSGRVAAVVFIIVVFSVIIIVRLAAIQLFDVYDLRKKAGNQGMLTETVLPERGLILDRNNKILATNVITYDLGTRFIDLQTPEQTFSRLAEVFGTSKNTYYAKTGKKNNFIYLEKNVSPSLVDSLKSSELCHGIKFERKMTRIYPYKTNAAQLLGFLDYQHKGASGVEWAFDNILSGTPGKRLVKKDQRGNVISYENGIKEAAIDGGDVKLTLNIEYQCLLEDELKNAVTKNQAKNGMGIIMNPRTGEILAMANYPSFDPNNVGNSKTENRRNRAIADQFEPGSIFKIVPIAAALDKGIISTNSKIFCEDGAYKVKDRIIHDSEPHQWLSVEEVLILSSNIGTAKIVEQSGNRSIYDICRAFGFGQKTQLGFREETGGSLRPLDEWSGVDFSQIGMGQGITSTLLQMSCAYSTIANGGILLKPFVLKESYDKRHRLTDKGETTLLRRVIKKETSDELKTILEKVVTQGTGKSAFIDGYHIAGKTGTAQKADRGGYSNSKYYASFMGFFPADDPILVCGIAINEPVKGRHYGAVASAPAVKNVFRGIINTPGFEDILKADHSHISGLRPVSLSMISSDQPKDRTQLTPEKIPVKRTDPPMENTSIVMPDMVNFPIRYAKYKLENLGLKVETDAENGVVTSQDPLPGTYINTETLCKIMVK